MIEPLSPEELALEYNPGRVYQPGDRVRVGGAYYVAISASKDLDPRQHSDLWRKLDAPVRRPANPNVEE